MATSFQWYFGVFCAFFFGIFRYTGKFIGMVYTAFRDTMRQSALNFYGGWILLAIIIFNTYEFVNGFLATF
ncbi:hypothetical protein [Vibrio owensii]|uniref:hypothetical protein n=1 Tax=Vibrio owensii TaxID=696485 RepID=UPI00215C2216|nr:hypothetical protein [Vibrio owensii]MCR9943899.1 hypothetical protein [Vibrio owensii]